MRLPGRYKAFPLFLPCLRLLPDIFKVVIKEKSQPHVWVFSALPLMPFCSLVALCTLLRIFLFFTA